MGIRVPKESTALHLHGFRRLQALIPYLKSHNEGAKPSNVHLSQWAIYLGNLDS